MPSLTTHRIAPEWSARDSAQVSNWRAVPQSKADDGSFSGRASAETMPHGCPRKITLFIDLIRHDPHLAEKLGR